MTKTLVLFLALLSVSISAVASEDEKYKRAPVFLIHGQNYFETEEFQDLTTAAKMEAIMAYGPASAYKQYKSDRFKNVKNLYLQYNLRIDALRTQKSDNEMFLYLIEKAGIDETEFIACYREAVDWAEVQKQKSADELYALSKNPGTPAPPEVGHLVSGLQHEYLELAAEKGHKKAQIEYAAYRKEVDEYIERHQKTLPKGLRMEKYK